MITRILFAAVLAMCLHGSGCAQNEVNPPPGTSNISAERLALKAELEAMLETDQKHRSAIGITTDAAERTRLWAQQKIIDKLNQVRIDDIIKLHGWPGRKEFGNKASQAAFLVLQHSPLEMMKRYLPLLQKALDADEIRKESFALFDDRIRMYEGRPQLYGSQVRVDEKTGTPNFWQIEDEINVDKRRASMGLGPLATYAKHFKIDYVPVAERGNRSAASEVEKGK